MKERMVLALPAWARAAAIMASALLLASCVTGPPELADDLTPAEYFQRAQEATAQHDYGLALRWYAAFREHYADDPTPQQMMRLLWAEYESAFLYHKMGDDETALRRLRALVQSYEQPAAADYPAGPRILSLRIITELEPMAAEAAEPSADATTAGPQ
jgi:outer membrane protein assembly factor BamD (BamD/ComL family)